MKIVTMIHEILHKNAIFKKKFVELNDKLLIADLFYFFYVVLRLLYIIYDYSLINKFTCITYSH
jgi:hypothetical protein